MRQKNPRSIVLVVDDETGPRESLRMLLTPHHKVLTACDGAQALEIVRTERVDVMTVDLNMPGIDGEELMRTVHSENPSIEIIVITGCATLTSAQDGIRHGICDYLEKPFDVMQVTAAVSRAIKRKSSRTGLVTFLEGLGDVVGRHRNINRILEDIQGHGRFEGKVGNLIRERGEIEVENLERDPGNTIDFLQVLAETIEIHDTCMCGHARRVAFFAGMIADRLNLSLEDQERVRFAGFLHDLGKVGVPTDLLLRPGPLDPAELRIVEQHPVIGANLLTPLDLPRAISVAVRHHHEWWNGSGYPDGLAGDDIPLVSRIIGVADAYDAMSNDRPYRPALTRDEIMTEFKRFSGVQFDPLVTKEFLLILESVIEDLDLSLLAGSTQMQSGSPEA